MGAGPTSGGGSESLRARKEKVRREEGRGRREGFRGKERRREEGKTKLQIAGA